ncbi:MAG: tryptophan synthase subunit alpha [Aquificae bacterium]|nr:tryptophan synthase subunit alpha [Aquificota bacterium]
MGRLKETFDNLKERGEKALVSYLMVGYPDYDTSLRAFERVLSAGTDVLEIGFPFSDPVADGPTIQRAHEEALRQGIRFRDVLRLAETLRKRYDVPFLLMTYYNPVFRIGTDEFCRRVKESGIDGLIVPDLPPEEAEELKGTTEEYGLSFVPLAAPTSTERRLRKICEVADESVYFVSVTGTTGAREELPYDRIKKKVEEFREICNLPVMVGFGVSKEEHARKISSFADGVVVGSALVRLAGEGKLQELEKLVRELKGGTCPA